MITANQARKYAIAEYCIRKDIPIRREDSQGNYRVLELPESACISTSGLIVKNNYFYSFSDEQKGDIITFAQKVFGYSFREALEDIVTTFTTVLSMHKRAVTYQQTQNVDDAKKTFILPSKTQNEDRAIRYLSNKRNIALSPKIQNAISELVYEDNRQNIVFLCNDLTSGKPKAAIVRGMLSSFKGLARGSDTLCPFSIKWGLGDIEILYIFESPIDLLSYLSYNEANKGLYIALGGLRMETIANLLEHPFLKNLKRIYCLVDNDTPGIRFFLKLKNKYKDSYDILRKVPAMGKDWNEYISLRNTHKG